jgi:hypothetical protein
LPGIAIDPTIRPQPVEPPGERRRLIGWTEHDQMLRRSLKRWLEGEGDSHEHATEGVADHHRRCTIPSDVFQAVTHPPGDLGDRLQRCRISQLVHIMASPTKVACQPTHRERSPPHAVHQQQVHCDQPVRLRRHSRRQQGDVHVVVLLQVLACGIPDRLGGEPLHQAIVAEDLPRIITVLIGCAQ